MSENTDTQTGRRVFFRLFWGGVFVAMVALLLLPVIVGPHPPRTRIEVQNFLNIVGMATTNFHLDYGQFPWKVNSSGGISFDSVIRELAPNDKRLTHGEAPTLNREQRDYLTLSDRFLQLVDGTQALRDLWGAEFQIHFDSETNTATVWSLGPDLRDGTGDEILATISAPANP